MKLTNFRDLGGIETIHGRRVKPCMVLRAGQPVGLDEADRHELTEDYGLSLIVDFRRPFEVKEAPDDRLPGVRIVGLDLIGDSENGDASLDSFASIADADLVDQHMMQTYRGLVESKSAQEGLGRFLDLILDNDSGSTLFHCFAGKDRTGFGAALILWLLEVDDTKVMEDYLKTNKARVAANNELLDSFRKRGFGQETIDALSIALYVKREYLEYAERLMHEQYGDVFSYADQALGFGAEKVDALRAKLLTD
ncbi:tyrosine-protein phosphatase [Bifidobacterium xylocopae]|uniref:tyrosine-protein phosphatase n=1 Tax=Bifidobacterium xylocopae TaxID=2493119 RepID=UPI001374F8B0|nr:tyrosine-protein phosphatase [Bifidobacterium xylocopae]